MNHKSVGIAVGFVQHDRVGILFILQHIKLMTTLLKLHGITSLLQNALPKWLDKIGLDLKENDNGKSWLFHFDSNAPGVLG